MTIEIKTAVKNALNYLQQLKDDLGEGIRDIRLEEVDLSEDEKFWLITLSFKVLDDDPNRFSLLNLQNEDYKTEYKVFEVNAETGKVKSMKIRKV